MPEPSCSRSCHSDLSCDVLGAHSLVVRGCGGQSGGVVRALAICNSARRVVHGGVAIYAQAGHSQPATARKDWRGVAGHEAWVGDWLLERHVIDGRLGRAASLWRNVLFGPRLPCESFVSELFMSGIVLIIIYIRCSYVLNEVLKTQPSHHYRGGNHNYILKKNR
jgi:hypothetical protein